jgi:phosphoenolpyruvate---glycerone phosphotransferase subunit DhaL
MPMVSDGRELGHLFVRRWIGRVAEGVRDRRDYLTQLDAAIGDADHGVNMDRGLIAAIAKLEASDDDGPGQILETVGSTLVLSVGGAAGPLYGSAFRHMGRTLGVTETFDPEDLLTALRAGLEEIQRLGAATVGDKTMVDAYSPALDAFARGLRSGQAAVEAGARARAAAEEGMRSTIPMQARKGRASYLGARSIGHQDPGATSTAILFAALEQTLDDGGAG